MLFLSGFYLFHFLSLHYPIASIFNISILTQTISGSFILTHFSCKLTPSLLAPSQTTQTVIPVCSSCSPAVARVCVTLFPHGQGWGSPHCDPANPISFSLCSVLPHVLFLSLLMPSKNQRGMAFVSSAGVPGGWKGAQRLWLPTIGRGEVIQPGIPHLWQVLTHMSQPVTPEL